MRICRPATANHQMLRRPAQEWEKLWTINKRLIDPVAPRHTAVAADGRVPLTLSNGPEVEEVEIVPAHKKNPEVGQKASVRSRVRSPINELEFETFICERSSTMLVGQLFTPLKPLSAAGI